MTVCLVTGGAGFIGSHLVDALVAQGHTIRVLDNFSTGNLANLVGVRARIELIEGDLADLDLVREAMRGVELVFHQAAVASIERSVLDPRLTHRACADGTLHVLMAARELRARRVICGASAAVYGDGDAVPRRETDSLHPVSPYAVATLAGEHYCAAFGHVYGLETVRLRYFNVVGPRQQTATAHAAVIPHFLEAMRAGRRPVIHGDGKQTRDFTSVDDVVQANLLAADAPRVAGRVYNVASGRPTSILELVERINVLLETDLRPIHTPARPGDIRHSQADISRAQADLGYCPCTDLGRELRRCLKLYSAAPKGPKSRRKHVYNV